MTCYHDPRSTCPFAHTEESDIASNYGCLPTIMEIRNMRVNHGRTWACHDEPTKACTGAIIWLKNNNLPHKVENPDLLTENSDWHLFVS